MSNKIPMRNELNIEDTWDLTDYYQTDDAWEAAFDEIGRDLELYGQYRGHLRESADVLYDCLKLDDQLGMAMDRLYRYASQKSDQDTTVSKYQIYHGRAYDLFSKLVSESAFISVELIEMGMALLQERMEEKPELKLYERLFTKIIKRQEHTRNESEERLLAEAGTVTGAAGEIFTKFNNADVKFVDAVDGEGNTHPISHGSFIRCLESKDRVLRKSAYESMYSSYRDFQNVLASMLNSNHKEHSFYTRVRGYESPMHYALGNNDIPVKVYEQLVEAVHEGLPQMYRYVELRKKMLGVDQLCMYDVYAPIVKTPVRRYTLEEAKELILKALAPMGEEYCNLLREGFENRWIDVYENQGKRSGAYSTCSYGVHPYVLMSFNGTLSNVFTLAHEMGHSLHSWYSNHNQPFVYAGYKIFVAEVASTVNESLLNQYLMEHAESDEEKAYILNHYLESFKGTFFRQTMFAEFEKITHEKVWAGEVLTAEGLREIYRKLNEQYFGPTMNLDSFIEMEWARIPHFYSPFYVYQYATGFSAAVALSRRILTLGEEGVEDYKKFLKGGSSMDPIDLLKLAGVDMTTKEPMQAAVKVFGGLLDEMEQLLA